MKRIIALLFLFSVSLCWSDYSYPCSKVLANLNQSRDFFSVYSSSFMKGCTNSTSYFYNPAESYLNPISNYEREFELSIQKKDYEKSAFYAGKIANLAISLSYPLNCLRFSDAQYYASFKNGISDSVSYADFYRELKPKFIMTNISFENKTYFDSWNLCRDYRVRTIQSFVSGNSSLSLDYLNTLLSNSIILSSYTIDYLFRNATIDFQTVFLKRAVVYLSYTLIMVPFIIGFLIYKYVKKRKLRLTSDFSQEQIVKKYESTALSDEWRDAINWIRIEIYNPSFGRLFTFLKAKYSKLKQWIDNILTP